MVNNIPCGEPIAMSTSARIVPPSMTEPSQAAQSPLVGNTPGVEQLPELPQAAQSALLEVLPSMEVC